MDFRRHLQRPSFLSVRARPVQTDAYIRSSAGTGCQQELSLVSASTRARRARPESTYIHGSRLQIIPEYSLLGLQGLDDYSPEEVGGRLLSG
jgi:hypothetical protein